MRTHVRRGAALLATTTLALVGGCKGDGDEEPGGEAAASEIDERAVADIAEGLEPGDAEITITGDLQSTGEYTGGGWNVKYSPAARGSTNREGPHRLQLMADLEGEHDRARVSISFHPGIDLGEYELTYAGPRDLEHGQVSASITVGGGAGIFSTNVDGTAEFAELGETVTARFAFDISNRDGDTVTVEGRARGIPYEPRPEGSFVATGAADAEWEGGATFAETSNGNYAVSLGSTRGDERVGFTLPPDIEPGTHALVRRGDGLRVNVPGRPDEIEGTLELRRDGDYLHGKFELKGTGDADVEVKGAFEHVFIPEQAN